ncbi:EamA family transporter [Deinococcus malanensis]|uniref:EamA family transporter n=1 Tax=Deinococcus malanensis TaxID=1706855 RepID=UPI0036387E59
MLIWSGFILVSRLGAQGTLSAFDVAALRFGVSGLVMLPYLLRHGAGGLTLPQVAALGVSAGLGYAMLAYSGFQLAPAAHAAVFMPGMLPFFTAALAWWFLGSVGHAAASWDWRSWRRVSLCWWRTNSGAVGRRGGATCCS